MSRGETPKFLGRTLGIIARAILPRVLPSGVARMAACPAGLGAAAGWELDVPADSAGGEARECDAAAAVWERRVASCESRCNLRKTWRGSSESLRPVGPALSPSWFATFSLYPKFHLLLHQFYGLVWQAEKLSWVENPLTDSCQCCESFIGSISRLSRRVSPKSTIERTMDLYLMTLWKHWNDA